jgi:AbrB family looped-hinge helix DNA binding protein
MATITLSSKYQVVIPRETRERLGWKPGQKLQPIVWKGHLQLIPVVPMAEAFGMLGPSDIEFERPDEDREF